MSKPPDDHAVVVRSLARFGLEPQDQVAIGAARSAEGLSRAWRHWKSNGSQPQRSHFQGFRRIAELEAPIEAGAERMRIDIVVEEGRGGGRGRRPRMPGDLAAEHRDSPFARLLDRHVDVDVAPDHQVVAGAAGHAGFAEMRLEKTEKLGLLEQAIGTEQEIASRTGALGSGGHGAPHEGKQDRLK